MRCLTVQQAHSNLRLGKAIEQWLDRRHDSDRVILRWFRIDKPNPTDFVVSLYEAVEAERGKDDLYDLYAVELDSDGAPQQVFGAARESSFSSAEEAIHHVVSLGGSQERFVNAGFIQDVYNSIVED